MGPHIIFHQLQIKKSSKKSIQVRTQYGGWCAYAMGKDGSKLKIDPETFKIINGKLYVFYNKFFNNTLKSWNKDDQLHQQADANWQKIYHELIRWRVDLVATWILTCWIWMLNMRNQNVTLNIGLGEYSHKKTSYHLNVPEGHLVGRKYPIQDPTIP